MAINPLTVRPSWLSLFSYGTLIMTLHLRLLLAALVLIGSGVWASPGKDKYFSASDGLKLHYLEAGSGTTTLVFIPGWLMPARIFDKQLYELSKDHRVIVLDPRGQGLSKAGSHPLDAATRARDIDELLTHAQVGDHVLIGWSLGVMEVLEHVVRHQRAELRAMVLIDNSIGMGRPPTAAPGKLKRPVQPDEFRAYVKRFAAGMFKSPPPSGWLEAIETSATQLHPRAAWALLNKPYHRDFYKKAVLDSQVPIWYAITPRFAEQSVELLQSQPRAIATVFEQAGHALFVDDADLFNLSLRQFLERLR